MRELIVVTIACARRWWRCPAELVGGAPIATAAVSSKFNARAWRRRMELDPEARHRASPRDRQDPHPSRLARPSTAPSSGQGLRSIPTGLIPHRSPRPSSSAPEPTFPLGPRSSETPKGPRIIAPRAEKGPQKCPIPGRGPVCLAAHESSSTVPLDEKGRFKFLFARRFH